MKLELDERQKKLLFNDMEATKSKRDKQLFDALKSAHGDTCADYLLSVCEASFARGRIFEFKLPNERMLPYWCEIGFAVLRERHYLVTHHRGRANGFWRIMPPHNKSVDTTKSL